MNTALEKIYKGHKEHPEFDDIRTFKIMLDAIQREHAKDNFVYGIEFTDPGPNHKEFIDKYRLAVELDDEAIAFYASKIEEYKRSQK